MGEVVELAKVETFLALGPGTWAEIAVDAEGEGVVWVACGECGVRGSLEDHTIGPDGTVRPSLVCPAECGWHIFAKLVGWTR